MIEAREFRLGNYVNYPHLIYSKNIPIAYNYDIIAGIENNSIRTNNSNGYFISDLLPIEINHEWLLKFGFVKEKKGWYALKRGSKKDGNLKIFRIALFYSGYNTKGGCMGGYNGVKYVHQLQNLYFLLTGQELTIK